MYNKGQDELTAENFDAANQSFDEIIRIEPSYKDIKTLKTATVNEPDYRRGQNYLQNKEYKLAYNTFDKVYQNEPTYKEIGRLREVTFRHAGGGTGKDIATFGGAVAGAVVGSNVGRDAKGQTVYEQNVQRCSSVSGPVAPAYWEVHYSFRGQDHRAQMMTQPGPTIVVNDRGEPRV